MSKKIRLNLDDLKVQSFVTTIDSKERQALQGAGYMQESMICTGWLQCGGSAAYCGETNSGCSVSGGFGSSSSFTCEPQTTYCTTTADPFCYPTNASVCP